MGPAVTLEKSSIGVKTYLPIPQVMPRLAQSTRRHSGSVNRFQDSLKKPHVVKSLRRQWSFDCVLGREDSDIPVEGDEPCLFGDVSEIKQFSTSHTAHIANTNLAGLDCHSEENCYQQKEMGPHDLKANQQGMYHLPKHETVHESVSSVGPLTSASSHITKTVQNLELNSVKLTQRISALLRKMKHMHKKGIQLNSDKYLHQMQAALRRGGIPSEDLSHLMTRLSEKIGSSKDGCPQTDSMIAETKPFNSSFEKDSIFKNFIDEYVKYIDPDATDSCSSDQDVPSNQETNRDDFQMRESSRVGGNMISNWRHLKKKLISIDNEIKVYKRHVKRMNEQRRNEGGWMVKGRPGSLKFVLSRQASRCLPFNQFKKWKLINMTHRDTKFNLTDQCASNDHNYVSLSSPKRDQYKISQVLWNRWNNASEEHKKLQISKPSEFPHHLCDSWSEFLDDKGKEFQKSKSTTRVHQLLGNRSRRDGARSSASKVGGEASRGSTFDINDVVMATTHSSLKSSAGRKKEIDVPTWRYVSCHFTNHKDEVEDTSDETFSRRHLQPELVERKQRIPDVQDRRLHRHKTNRNPGCHGDVKREPSFDGLSLHSFDEVSWFSAAVASSDDSATSRLEGWNKRNNGDHFDDDDDDDDDDDSYSTTSACSPLNPDL